MPAQQQSLLTAPSTEQLELLTSDQMEAEIFAEDEQRGEFTGARLFAQNPEKYRTIISLLAEGLGVIRIGKMLQVSPNTVVAIREREPEAIDIAKQRISSLARRGAHICIEGIIEALLDEKRRLQVSAKDMAIIAGVLVDKSELLSGGATVRIGLTADSSGHMDFNAYIASLQRVGPDPAGMESAGGAPEQKGEALLVPGSAAETGSKGADADSLSGDNASNTKDSEQ